MGYIQYGEFALPEPKMLEDMAPNALRGQEPLQVQGFLTNVKERKVGKEKKAWMVTGRLHDGQQDIGFKRFFGAEKFPNGSGLKEDMWVRMEGKLKTDKYGSQQDGGPSPEHPSVNGTNYALEFTAVQEEEPPKDTDKAKEKRVELQGFTHMSELRSAISVETLIERAAELGHEAVALTDVNSVQAFPAAHKAATEHGVQIIYGATMLLAGDKPQNIYYGDARPLRDATYVVYDLESTGFSVNNDYIIEIGATKMHRGKITDTFQRFVRSPKPIPPAVVELTGITNEMMATGDSIQSAIEDLECFMEGCVEVAHNAQFDNDFLTEAYQKIGKNKPKRPLIDTLELSRSLYPEFKTHRLDTASKRHGKFLEEEMKNINKDIRSGKTESLKWEKQMEKWERVLKRETEKGVEETKLEELRQKLEDGQSRLHELKEKEQEWEKQLVPLKYRKNGLEQESHHRADDDAKVTAHLFLELMLEAVRREVDLIQGLNDLLPNDLVPSGRGKEITLWTRNEEGKRNLYHLITKSHTEYLQKIPTVTKDLINQYREGLFVGTGSHNGHVFQLTLNKPAEQAQEEMDFYDYVEIQPADIASHLFKNGTVDKEEVIEETWKKVYALAIEAGKPVVATGHVHYPYSEDKDEQYKYHNVLLYHGDKGARKNLRAGQKNHLQIGRHFRKTEEMKEAFPWLSEDERQDVVVTNTRELLKKCQSYSPLPTGLHPPEMGNAEKKMREIAEEKAVSIYGSPLPNEVSERLETELHSIITNQYSVIYLISRELVQDSEASNYPVGSRGSVGSSFAATMTGITEVNPLSPHYVSKETSWSVFFDHPSLPSGFDLPDSLSEFLHENKYAEDVRHYVIEKLAKSWGSSMEETKERMASHAAKQCPITGKENALMKEGQKIPFETFLGFNGDKIPDIDLNFSSEYQPRSHQYVKNRFGEKSVFRAGTISTTQERYGFGYAKGYIEENEIELTNSQLERLAKGLIGSKRSTGQHPGGVLVVPPELHPEEFTPLQYPANNKDTPMRTSHLDFHSIDDNLLKLDILGHDDPTILNRLTSATKVDVSKLNPTDEQVMALFLRPMVNAEGKVDERMPADTGTLGVPELGTPFVRKMITKAKPKTFDELVKISGLSHGENVWVGNAEQLIDDGVITIKDVIDTRDTIMVTLLAYGLDPSLSFQIMEFVRKGKGLKPEWEEAMKQHEVPEWFIGSCKKIKYMFPKAHAVAYVTMALRIANFKVYYPEAFYAAVLGVRYASENITEMDHPIHVLVQKSRKMAEEIPKLHRESASKANNMSNLKNALDLRLEAMLRGVKFGKVQVGTSLPLEYTAKDGVIYPPLCSIPGLGEKAALDVHRAFLEKPFSSLEDLEARGAKKDTIKKLSSVGAIQPLEETQYYLFSTQEGEK